MKVNKKTIRQILDKLYKYFIVGIIGIIIDNGVILLLTLVFFVPANIATLISAEVGNLNNFFINDNWTFKDNKNSQFIIRILKYHISILLGFVIARVFLFPEVFSFASLYFSKFFAILIANNVSIGVSFIFNFIINFIWTWGASQKDIYADIEKDLEQTEFR